MIRTMYPMKFKYTKSQITTSGVLGVIYNSASICDVRFIFQHKAKRNLVKLLRTRFLRQHLFASVLFVCARVIHKRSFMVLFEETDVKLCFPIKF